MRVHLNAKVRTSDGHDAGTVERAVVAPERNEITDFVVSTGGLLPRSVLVPREEIERASEDGEALRLRLSQAEVEQLPGYVERDYTVPPPGWAAPAAYAFPYSAYAWPAWPVGYVGAYPGAIAPAPESSPEPEAPPGQSPPVTPDTAASPVRVISLGALVVDTNGDEIGVVDDLRFHDDTGDLEGIVLRVGGVFQTLLGGGDPVFVSANEIEEVREETVRLRSPKEVLTRLVR